MEKSSQPKFHTTRDVRRLAGIVREFMRAAHDVDDVGETSSEQMQAWLYAFMAGKPGHILTVTWNRAQASVQQRMFAEWEYLRGPNKLEHATQSAERANQRNAERHPLFAVMGALEEIAPHVTPEARLVEFERAQAQFRENSKKPTIAEATRKKVLETADVVPEGKLSFNQCCVWGRLLSYFGLPNLPEARERLVLVSGDNPDKLRANMENIVAFGIAALEATKAKTDGNQAHLARSLMALENAVVAAEYLLREVQKS